MAGKGRRGAIKDSIASITEEDISQNAVVRMIDPDKIVTDFKYSWDELLVALLSLTVYVKQRDLTSGLIEMKATTPNMVILPNVPYDTFNDGKSRTYYKIPGTQYYMCNKMNETEYIWMINQLCKGLKMNPKKCKLVLSSKSFEINEEYRLNKEMSKSIKQRHKNKKETHKNKEELEESV